MATKAQKFKATEIQLQRERTSVPPPMEKSVAKIRTQSEKTGRKAGNKHHPRPANYLEHTEQLRQGTPEARAAVNAAKAMAVRGKARGVI